MLVASGYAAEFLSPRRGDVAMIRRRQAMQPRPQLRVVLLTAASCSKTNSRRWSTRTMGKRMLRFCCSLTSGSCSATPAFNRSRTTVAPCGRSSRASPISAWSATPRPLPSSRSCAKETRSGRRMRSSSVTGGISCGACRAPCCSPSPWSLPRADHLAAARPENRLPGGAGGGGRLDRGRRRSSAPRSRCRRHRRAGRRNGRGSRSAHSSMVRPTSDRRCVARAASA